MQTGLKRYLFAGVVCLIVFGLSMASSIGTKVFAAGAEDGRKLFESNCISCHSIGGGKGVGPDLKGVTEARDKEWLKKMIGDPKALADSGDPTVKKLVEEYGMVMPKINVTDPEIDSIITYLENQSAQGAGGSDGAGTSQGGSQQLSVSTFAVTGIFGALVLFAIIAGLGQGRLKGVRKNL